MKVTVLLIHFFETGNSGYPERETLKRPILIQQPNMNRYARRPRLACVCYRLLAIS